MNYDLSLRIMKTGSRKSFLTGIPSWALALMAMVGEFIILMVIPEDLVNLETKTGETIAYIILGLVNAIFCFFIVRQNPKSMWYIPLIINVIYIISAFVESMKASDWIAVCGILALSFIASITGARVGRKKADYNNP